MNSREQRIRALAASMATQRDAASLLWTPEACIVSAAHIIDAIDALPVPGACKSCDGTRKVIYPCPECTDCNGTGRQEDGDG